MAALLILVVAAPAAAQTVPADVVRVIDGDTVVVDAHPWPGWTLRVSVRVAGIDAPEKRARCAAEAAGAARAETRLVELLARGPLILIDPVHGRFAGRVIAALHQRTASASSYGTVAPSRNHQAELQLLCCIGPWRGG